MAIPYGYGCSALETELTGVIYTLVLDGVWASRKNSERFQGEK
jgi:hypothetical protein